MQYREPYSDCLSDLHPFEKTKAPNPNRIAVSFGKAGVPNLVRVLAEPALSEDALVNGLTILRSTMTCQEDKITAIQEGLVETLRNGLENVWRVSPYDGMGGKMVAARCIAVDVLGSLCLLKEGRGEICLRGCLPQLFKLLESKHGKMRAAATKAVRQFTDFPDGVEAMLGAKPFKDVLVDRLVDDAIAVSLDTCAMFANLTSVIDGVQLALDCDIMKHLVRFLTDSRCPTQNVRRKMLCYSLTSIWNICHDESGNAVAISCKAVQQICDASESVKAQAWTDVERCTAGALMALAVSEDGKKNIASHGVQVLLALASKPQADTKRNACDAIRLASEFPAAKKLFVGVLLPDTPLIVLVYRVRALKSIVPFLRANNAETQDQAARLVSQLVRDNQGQQEALQVLHLVDALADLLLSPRRSTQHSAYDSLKIVCNSSDLGGKMLARKAIKEGSAFKRAMVQFPDLQAHIIKWSKKLAKK